MAGYLMRRPEPKATPNEEAAKDYVDASNEQQATKGILPPTIDREHVCKRCYAVDGCMLYRRAVEGIDDKVSDIAELYDAKTSHLTTAQTAFFKKWEALLSLEEQDLVRFRRELWTMTAAAREKVGRCFADMVIDGSAPGGAPDGALTGMHKHTYRFVRMKRPDASQRTGVRTDVGTSLLSGHIAKGDPVTISIDPSHLSVAQGFVLDLTPTAVTIGLDHSLDAVLARAREEFADGWALPSDDSRAPNGNAASQTVFRIDRDELSAGMGRIRYNLARLFFAGEAGDERRRELVVDLATPKFAEGDPLEGIKLPAHLNEDQRDAVSKVLAAEDYALVLGMPGTGKTTTIAELIRLLARQGKSVLLTSYTHSAVDTILCKLLGAPELDILRLGNADKVHPDVRPLTLGYTPGPRARPTTVAQLEQQLFSPNVVATTCLSIGHVLFSRRKFDYCIVDEASQITLPTCVGPLRFADRFVLVGDHFQLPPLVRDPSARAGGLDISLFKRLSDAHSHALTYLRSQYRMNEDIMALSNHLIYGGRLRCGSPWVARSVLALPRRAEALAHLHRPRSEAGEGYTKCACDTQAAQGRCWLDELLDDR